MSSFASGTDKEIKEDFVSQTHSIQTTEDTPENKVQSLRSQRELGSTIVTSSADSADGRPTWKQPDKNKTCKVEQRVYQNPTMKEFDVKNGVVLQRLVYQTSRTSSASSKVRCQRTRSGGSAA